jgi:membrane protease YdiL (CAAX protease family)
MSSLEFIKRNSVLTYFSIVFLSSWGLIILLAGPGNLPIDAEQSKELLPLLYMLMLVGPSLAGLLLTGLIYGKSGFLRLKEKLLTWRKGIRWYLLAISTAPILAMVILLLLSRLSPEFNLGISSSAEKTSFLLSGIFIGLMVGLFEEIGWSGFVVPRLRQRYTIFMTGLIVGIFWGAWHFILFWERDSFSGMLPLLILLGRLFAWLPPFRIFMVWILDRTESLLIVILTHASLVFTTTILVPMTLTGKYLLSWLILWGAALWIIVLVIAIAKGGIFTHNPVE